MLDMIKTAKYAAAAMIVALIGAPSSAQAFQVFTSRAAWEAALYGTGFFLSDTIDDASPILTDGATVSLASSSPAGQIVDIGGARGFVIRDEVDGSPQTGTVFTFTRSMYAFGAAEVSIVDVDIEPNSGSFNPFLGIWTPVGDKHTLACKASLHVVYTKGRLSNDFEIHVVRSEELG